MSQQQKRVVGKQQLPMTMNPDKILHRIYYDVSNPASFGSVDKLFRAANEVNSSIKRSDVEKFLSGEFAYTLHRKIVRRFRRNPVVSNFHTELAQADLIDVIKYSTENDGYRYILTMIDVFSKVAFAVPIKTKSAVDMESAIEEIFVSYKPSNLQTDEGREFTNARVQKLLKSQLVHFYLAKNEVIKCAVVERFQRTLMTRISKYFTSQGHQRYIDMLPDFLSSYNNTYHRSIRMTPVQATSAETSVVFMNLYGYKNERDMLRDEYKRNPKHEVGTSVRVPKIKNVFEKGYRQTFTDEIFKIDSKNSSRNQPVYKLKDYRDHIVPGTFYEYEVQKVAPKDLYRVEVLGKRKRGAVTQIRVRYVNFPEVQPEWINESNIQNLS